MDTTELVGYIAMAFLVVSFLPKQIRKIRLINFIGCSLFVIYGILNKGATHYLQINTNALNTEVQKIAPYDCWGRNPNLLCPPYF